MKPLDNPTGMERVVTTLLGKTAETVTKALTNKLLGKPKPAKRRPKRKPVPAKAGQTAATAGKEVRHA